MAKVSITKTEKQLRLENEELRSRLAEMEETLNAIRNGEVDAIVVSGADGERIFSLTSAETPYRIIIEEMNDGAAIVSAERTIIYCNRRFAELVSVPSEQITGSDFSRFVAKNEKQKFDALVQAGLKGKSAGEITYVTPDGNTKQFMLLLSALPYEMSGEVCIITSDITELKQKEKGLQRSHDTLEQRVTEKTTELSKTIEELAASRIAAMNMMEDAVEAKNDLQLANKQLIGEITERKKAEEKIKASLKEKEALLQEIHHRVKNNLQVVSSLLNIQARTAKDKDTVEILSESRDRINTMALIHAQLYESTSLSEVNMKEFADGLIRQLFQSFQVQSAKIIPIVNVADYPLPISMAVPVGLILNELLTNAFKYAFAERKKGEIMVSFDAPEKDKISLTVSDDGVGLPRGFDIDKSETFGLKLVKILVEDQLQGNIEITGKKGTTFKVEFEIGNNKNRVS